MNGDRKRRLTLNRETVRVLSSREMSGIAGGAAKLTDQCETLTDPPKPNTVLCSPTGSSQCPTVAKTCFCSFLDCNRAVLRAR